MAMVGSPHTFPTDKHGSITEALDPMLRTTCPMLLKTHQVFELHPSYSSSRHTEWHFHASSFFSQCIYECLQDIHACKLITGEVLSTHAPDAIPRSIRTASGESVGLRYRFDFEHGPSPLPGSNFLLCFRLLACCSLRIIRSLRCL